MKWVSSLRCHSGYQPFSIATSISTSVDLLILLDDTTDCRLLELTSLWRENCWWWIYPWDDIIISGCLITIDHAGSKQRWNHLAKVSSCWYRAGKKVQTERTMKCRRYPRQEIDNIIRVHIFFFRFLIARRMIGPSKEPMDNKHSTGRACALCNH